jgi:dTDP-4-amino-4,6-dideoxygalactose transaminase
MSQPISGSQYTIVSGTAAGTTVVAARPARLARIFIPANRTGTVSVYDCATAAGTTAANAITDITCTVGSIPTSIEFDVNTYKGITCVTGGTTNILFITD